MTDKAKLRDEVRKNVRALLISAPMGLSINEVERDYKEIMGYGIPALQLGFNSPQDLLLEMPDVAQAQWQRGNLVLHGVADSTTVHLKRLVSRQRKDTAKILKKREKSNRRRVTDYNHYQPYVKPSRYSGPSPFTKKQYKPATIKAAVPASLQSHVKQILKRYPSGISNSEFLEAFLYLQSYNLNFKKLGFDNLWEFLRGIPDVSVSHNSKDEYDIFLVRGNVQAVPAGYENDDNDLQPEPEYFAKQSSTTRSHSTRTIRTEIPPLIQKTQIEVKPVNDLEYFAKPSSTTRSHSTRTIRTEIPPRIQKTQTEVRPANDLEYFAEQSNTTRSHSTRTIRTEIPPRIHKTQTEVRPANDLEYFAEQSNTIRSHITRTIRTEIPPHIQHTQREVRPANDFKKPSNSRTPWSIAGVPCPQKTLPSSRVKAAPTNRIIKHFSSKKTTSSKYETRERSNIQTHFTIELETEAPFEKAFLDEIRQILADHPNGLWSTELPKAYKKLTKKTLPFLTMGYYGVVELVLAIPDVITVDRENDSDWKLYDARKKPFPTSHGQEIASKFLDEDIEQDVKTTLEYVKEKLRLMLEDFEDTGVLLEDLEIMYQRKYNRKLPLQELGFQDIDSLILLIPDAVKVVYRGHGKVYAFAEKESRGLPKYDARKAALCALPQDAVGYGYRYRDSEIPNLKEYFEVYVSSVYTPHKLSIQLRDKDQNCALEELMDELEAVYKYPEGEHYLLPESMIAVNQLCCAIYLEDNNWHRAIITGVVDNDFVEVNYVDYGSSVQVPKSCLRLLKACFLKLPAMAIDAKLVNLKPVMEKWSTKSRDRLLQLTMDKPLIAFCPEMKNKVLSIFLCDTTTEEDVHINDVLIKEEYALFSSSETEQQSTANVDAGSYVNPVANVPPSDFIMSMEQLSELCSRNVEQEEAGGRQLIDSSSSFTNTAITTDVHPAPAAAMPTSEDDALEDTEHWDETYVPPEADATRDEEGEKFINRINEELDGIDAESESSLEEIDESVENNLNMEDIQLTMRFLEARRKRHLEVLSSSDNAVDVVDELNETETLINHFKERLKKVSNDQTKSAAPSINGESETSPLRKVEFATNRSSEDSNVIQHDDTKSKELLISKSIDETYPEIELPQKIDDKNKEDNKISADSGIDPQSPSTVSEDPESSVRFTVTGLDTPDNNRLQTNTVTNERNIGNITNRHSVVDPIKLEDLGQMLRNSLQVSAEPFKSKQTAAISPFCRPNIGMQGSSSAFLDNSDTLQQTDTSPSSVDASPNMQPPLDQFQQVPADQLMFQQSVASRFTMQEQFMPSFQPSPLMGQREMQMGKFGMTNQNMRPSYMNNSNVEDPSSSKTLQTTINRAGLTPSNVPPYGNAGMGNRWIGQPTMGPPHMRFANMQAFQMGNSNIRPGGMINPGLGPNGLQSMSNHRLPPDMGVSFAPGMNNNIGSSNMMGMNYPGSPPVGMAGTMSGNPYNGPGTQSVGLDKSMYTSTGMGRGIGRGHQIMK